MASTHVTEPVPEPVTECESESSNIEIETCFSECGDHINDENLRLFEDVFLASEQDERKTLPSLPPIKKIFLQILFLKTTYQKSWKDLSTWMTALFPSYPPEKCRHLVEKTKKEAQSLITTPAKFAEFLNQEVDLYFLGPRCQAEGITRQSCDDPNIPDHERRITRGILLELATAFGHSQELFMAVDHLYPNRYTKKHITGQCRTTKQKHVKYIKNKSRSDLDSKYLDEEIEFTISPQSITEPAQSSQGCSQGETSNEKVEEISQEMTNKLKDKQEQLLRVSEKEDVIMQICKEKSKQILAFESPLDRLESDVADRSAKIEELQLDNDEKNEVKNLKRSSISKSLMRKEKYPKTKENDRGVQDQYSNDHNVEH